jgi:hypothetical protein
MSSVDTTHVECNNHNVITALVAAVRSRGIDYTGCKEWKDGDKEIIISTVHYTLGIVQIISEQFPDETITCEHYYESTPYELYKVEYLNGKSKSYDLQPCYFPNIIHLDNENDCEGILKKAVSFCRRLDTTEKHKDGILFINWFSDEVCFKFEYDGADGTKYRVEATKQYHHIDIKVFEGRVKYDWWEISSSQKSTGDAPL